MKLLLQRNVSNLGKLGEIVNVSDGYGRNFLLPEGLAVEVTKDNLHRFEVMKRRLIAQEQETIQKFQLLAKELQKVSCTIIANSTEEGHLYGSVAARDITTNLATEGLEIDPKCVIIEEPIKKLGIYKVMIRLHPEVECEAKVWVVKGDDGEEGRRALVDNPEIAEGDVSGDSEQ